MKRLFMFAIVSVLAASAHAKFDVEKCLDNNPTNMGMKMCASKQLESAQKDLAVAVKKNQEKIAANFEGEDAKEVSARLTKAQKTWSAFVEAQCDLDAADMLGGTGEGLIKLSCMANMTEERVIKLEKDAASDPLL